MKARRIRPSRSLAAQAAELAVAVPQVVAHRLVRMAMVEPNLSARDKKEFARMFAEKNAAFSESWSAMAWQSLRSQQALAAALARSAWTPPAPHKPAAHAIGAQMQRAALAVFGKGLAPVHRRAVANAKRLAKTRLR